MFIKVTISTIMLMISQNSFVNNCQIKTRLRKYKYLYLKKNFKLIGCKELNKFLFHNLLSLIKRGFLYITSYSPFNINIRSLKYYFLAFKYLRYSQYFYIENTISQYISKLDIRKNFTLRGISGSTL